MPITLPIGDVVKCSQCGGQTRSLSRGCSACGFNGQAVEVAARTAVSDDFDAHIVAREAELNAPTRKHIAYRRHDQINTCVCDYGRDHIADLDDFDAACGTSVACEYDCPGRPANRNRYARPQRGASC